MSGFKKPTRTPREETLSATDFQNLLTLVDEPFADYLKFAYYTGARPQEIRILTAKHFDGQKFIIPRKQAKGKKHPRVIYLNRDVLALVKRLIDKYPNGVLFRNAKGKPWTANSVRSRFDRLKQSGKLDVEGMHATALRHTFCTNSLKAGVDTTTVAELMGHRDTSMVSKVYQHLGKDHAYMQRAIERATSADTALST